MMNSKNDNQAFVTKLADIFCRLGLQVPVLVGLEAGRPFAFLGGQLLWVAKPVLGIFVPGESINHLAELLEDPNQVESLIAALEARESV